MTRKLKLMSKNKIISIVVAVCIVGCVGFSWHDLQDTEIKRSELIVNVAEDVKIIDYDCYFKIMDLASARENASDSTMNDIKLILKEAATENKEIEALKSYKAFMNW